MAANGKHNLELAKLGICPKCGRSGGLSVDSDLYGTFLNCLYCGLLEDLESNGKDPSEILSLIDERGRIGKA